MWTNKVAPGWAHMIIKPEFGHTRLRGGGTYASQVPVVAFMVGSLMVIQTAIFDSEGGSDLFQMVALILVWLPSVLALFCGRFWLGNPEVRVDAAGLTIQNLWRTHRVAWRDVERLDLAGYAGITVKTRDQEILCAGLRCSAVEWLPIGRDSRRRARWELERVRTWLDQCRSDAVAAGRFANDPLG